jgi:hypothetical protein
MRRIGADKIKEISVNPLNQCFSASNFSPLTRYSQTASKIVYYAREQTRKYAKNEQIKFRAFSRYFAG